MHKYIVRIPVLGYLEYEDVEAATPEAAIAECMPREWRVQQTLNLDKYMEVEPYRASAYPMIDGLMQNMPEQLPDGTPINALIGGLRVVEPCGAASVEEDEALPTGTAIDVPDEMIAQVRDAVQERIDEDDDATACVVKGGGPVGNFE